MNVGRLFFPALRWDPERGFRHQDSAIELALSVGVGGFIIFGGAAEAVRELTLDLRRRSRYPLLIGADLERGAGQQFAGATELPPAAAIGWVDQLGTTRRAGALTAREARALGVNWVYAPVADLGNEPLNPIVGTRAFGADPSHVARHVAAWVEGCRSEGALACAKHFPGHGRTVADSHAELPVVAAPLEVIQREMEPFRAAISVGVDSLMSAHVAYPALDSRGGPATLSGGIIADLLREDWDYDGLVVTDALIMEGVLEGGHGEAEAVVRAIGAGCDAMLYPRDLERVVEALREAVGKGVPKVRVEQALRRIESAASRVDGAPQGEWGREDDVAWANDLALRCIRVVRGDPRLPSYAVDVVTLDDDLGSPYPPPPRSAFPEALRAAGFRVRETTEAGEQPAVIALYCDIRAWKGRPGLSSSAKGALATLQQTHPETPVVLFGHPRLADEFPAAGPVLAAWGGESLMQRAAARWLAERRP